MHAGIRGRRWPLAVGAAGASVALLLAGCASQSQAQGTTGGGTSSSSGDQYYAAAVDEAKSLANGQKLDSSLEMIGVNSGVEGQTLEKLYKAFTDGAGVTVNYTGSQDTNTLVQSRVKAGNPPDVAASERHCHGVRPAGQTG